MFRNAIKSLVTGIQRRWKVGLTQAFSILGGIWLVTEIATKLSKSADGWLLQHGDLYTAGMCVAGAIWFIVYSYEVRFVSFLVPTTDFRITLRFGNLLSEPTDWLIGVNEFFDNEVGAIVSQNSLHGQFIAKVFSGDGAKFRTAVDTALIGAKSFQTERSIQPNVSYPIGTTAVIQNGERKTFLVAMTHTDPVTAKASSTVALLWEALNGALQSIHDYGNGAPLSMPLIGNGRASINIEPQHLLRLIVLALVDFGRKVGLPKQLTIVLPEACFNMLDIREIKRDWETK